MLREQRLMQKYGFLIKRKRVLEHLLPRHVMISGLYSKKTTLGYQYTSIS